MGRRSNYTAKQKAEVVLSVLSKQSTIAEGCRRDGTTQTTFALAGAVVGRRLWTRDRHCFPA